MFDSLDRFNQVYHAWRYLFMHVNQALAAYVTQIINPPFGAVQFLGCGNVEALLRIFDVRAALRDGVNRDNIGPLRPILTMGRSWPILHIVSGNIDESVEREIRDAFIDNAWPKDSNSFSSKTYHGLHRINRMFVDGAEAIRGEMTVG